MVIPVEIPVWINFIVLSPLAEEMMFRRVVLEHLKSLTTTSRAVIVGSILFSLFHLPWWLMSGEQQGVCPRRGFVLAFSLRRCVLSRSTYHQVNLVGSDPALDQQSAHYELDSLVP